MPILDPGLSAWNVRDEVLRWLFHGNSLSYPKDLLIPFPGTNPANFLEARFWTAPEVFAF
jgi:hypothetical protein